MDQLSQTMNEMRIKIVNQEENKHNESSEKIPNQADKQYFKCEECEFISASNVSLRKHINTKHTAAKTESQSEETRSCYMCGKDLITVWDFLKHL